MISGHMMRISRYLIGMALVGGCVVFSAGMSSVHAANNNGGSAHNEGSSVENGQGQSEDSNNSNMQEAGNENLSNNVSEDVELPEGTYRSLDGYWYYTFRSFIEGDDETKDNTTNSTNEAGSNTKEGENENSSIQKDIIIVGHIIKDAAIPDGLITENEEDGKTTFTIPSEIDGYKVTGIGNPNQSKYVNPEKKPDDFHEYECGLNNFNEYDMVVVPEGVDTIYQNCFYCSGFHGVQLPETLKEIGQSAFFYTPNLIDVEIPSSVEKIGGRAFRHSAWMDKMREEASQHLVIVNGMLLDGIKAEGNVVVPLIVNSICDWAFSGTGSGGDDKPSSLESVSIQSSVSSIGDYAFALCSSLAAIDLQGSGLENIGVQAFRGTAITEIYIPNKIKKLPTGLCYGCTKLESVTMTGAEVVGQSAFQKCTSLVRVSFPACLKELGKQSFYSCTALTDISIPKSVTTIGSHVFKYSSNLKKVVLPEELVSLGKEAFLTNSDSSADKLILTVPEKMTDISAFELLELNYVTLRVLAGSEVERYLIENEVPTYQTYLKGMQDIYEGTVNITNNNITNNDTTIIDNSTTNIDNSTTINNPVINVNPVINDNSVNNTNTDNSVNINTTDNSVNTTVNDSTVGNIGDNNGSIENGDGKKDDDKGVDDNIAGLVFTYGRSKYRVNDDEKTAAFICPLSNKKSSLIIPSTVKCKYRKLKVTDINKGACRGMKKLKLVVIGSNVENIGEKAFYNCTGLKSVTIGKNVSDIGKLAFYGNKKLNKVTFKGIKSLKSVDKAAFYLRTKKTDDGLKKKQTSKKKMLQYLINSGVKVKS